MATPTHPASHAHNRQLLASRTAEEPPPAPVLGCPLCERVGGRLLQNHEAFRIIAVDDHELPGVARIVWNHHVQEISDLSAHDQHLLMQAIFEGELQLRTLMRPHKVNVASLGNQVPHLHVHLIPRWRTDPWWPNTCWAVRPELVWRGIAPEAFITVGDWAQLKEGASQVRQRVFVEEQGVPQEEEWDELDRICRHALIRIGDTPIATGRLMPDGRIGRMAVNAEFRKNGFGRHILRSLIAEAQHRGVTGLYLHAQIQALGFYAKEGFSAEGEEFFECEIPHRMMRQAS